MLNTYKSVHPAWGQGTTFPFCPTGGFHGNSPFCLGEDEEVEIEVPEDFLSFSADLVAEQLTYMDAVRDHFYHL